ncbi:MAG: polysaccharide deacetylase family protein [Gemmatimonadaceae bacterium]|nr:polysaccharide deacetylase family protein [Gemmatimonadaceae bacterium]
MIGLTVGAVVVGSAAYGAFHRNSPVFGSVLGRLPTNENIVSLTFDDGPNPESTPRILDALKEKNVKATFFILGRHAERWPDLVLRIAHEGHQIGNHGYFHRKLHFKRPFYVRQDIKLGKRAIERAGAPAPNWFRAPHGFRNPWVNSIASSMGERVAGWSLGVWDTDKPGVKEIVKRTVDGTRAGSIILLHDGDGYDPEGDRMQTASAVPLIIDELNAKGFRFETLPA